MHTDVSLFFVDKQKVVKLYNYVDEYDDDDVCVWREEQGFLLTIYTHMMIDDHNKL